MTGSGQGRARDSHGHFVPDPATAERDAKALELRKQYKSYPKIAAELGMADDSVAYRAVQRALKATMQEAADEVRRMEVQRLDEMAERARAIAGDDREDPLALQALDRLMKIQERRARLLGLDAPQRYSVDAAQLGDEIKELLGLMGREPEAEADGTDDE